MAFVVTVYTKAHSRTISVDISCAEFTPLTEVWLSLHRFLLNTYLPNGITWTFSSSVFTHIVQEIIEHTYVNSLRMTVPDPISTKCAFAGELKKTN